MALTRTTLGRIIARKIRKRVDIEESKALDIAEDIIESIDDAMEAAEEGEGFRPPSYDREVPKDKPAIPASPAVREVPKGEIKSSVLVLPGDKEFSDTANQTKERKIIRAIPLTSVQRRQAQGERPKEHWTPGTLIEALEEYFPPEFLFTPDRTPPDVKIKAVRNIVQQAGLGTVNLEYKHPLASEDLGSIGTDESRGVVKLPLIARVTFSVFEEKIDADAAMENIVRQLKGMYAPRAKKMMPVMEEDLPLRLEDAAATDSDRTRMRPGWAIVEDTQATVIDQVRQQNKLDSGKVRP